MPVVGIVLHVIARMGCAEAWLKMELAKLEVSELAVESDAGIIKSDEGSAKLVAVLGMGAMLFYGLFGRQYLLSVFPAHANVIHISILANIAVVVLFASAYSLYNNRTSGSSKELITEVKDRIGLLHAMLDSTNEQIRDFEQEMIAHMSLVPARGTESLSSLKRITKAVEQRLLKVEGILRPKTLAAYRHAYSVLNEKLCFNEDLYTSVIGSEPMPAIEPSAWAGRIEKLASHIEAELVKAREQAYFRSTLSEEDTDVFANEDTFFSPADKIKSTTLG